jgi:hypothetical protein
MVSFASCLPKHRLPSCCSRSACFVYHSRRRAGAEVAQNGQEFRKLNVLLLRETVPGRPVKKATCRTKMDPVGLDRLDVSLLADLPPKLARRDVSKTRRQHGYQAVCFEVSKQSQFMLPPPTSRSATRPLVVAIVMGPVAQTSSFAPRSAGPPCLVPCECPGPLLLASRRRSTSYALGVDSRGLYTSQRGFSGRLCLVGTYRTIEELVPLVPALLDVALEGIRVQGLEQLKAAEELCRDRHDGTPVVKLSAVLLHVSAVA